MIFEQPKELNPLVQPEEKLSLRWSLSYATYCLLPFLPLLIGISVEIQFLKGLALWRMWMSPAPLVITLPVLAWWTHWIKNQSARFLSRHPRVLELSDRGVRMPGPLHDIVLWGAKRKRLDSRGQTRMSLRSEWWTRWSRVQSFVIEPIEAGVGCRKVTVHFRTGHLARWSMALVGDELYKTLLAELKRRQTVGAGRFTIDIYDQQVARPAAFPKPTLRTWVAVWLMSLSLFALLNGFALLFAPAFEPANGSRPEGRLHASLVRRIQPYQTRIDDEHGLMKTGWLIMAVGACCFGLGVSVVGSQRKDEPPFMGSERILPPPSTV